MTAEQLQNDRNQYFYLHSNYAELVTISRKLKLCGTPDEPTDEMKCPCIDCVRIRRLLIFRDRAWNAYLAISEQPGESASQEVVEAAAEWAGKPSAAPRQWNSIRKITFPRRCGPVYKVNANNSPSDSRISTKRLKDWTRARKWKSFST